MSAAPPTGDRGERPDHFCGPACEASGHAGVVRERPEHRASLAVHCDCLHAALAAERVRGDRLEALVREALDIFVDFDLIDEDKLGPTDHMDRFGHAARRALAANPEGGSPDG